MALWTWVKENAIVIGVLSVVVPAAFSGVWAVITYVFPPQSIIKGEPVDVTAIVDRLITDAARREEAVRERYQQQLGAAQQRGEEFREQFEKAVQALADQREKPGAPAGIDEALARLAEGQTEAAEAIFEEVLERREVEGGTALKDAAAAARHIGALAFGHDTEKSMAAYRKAVELDPDNAVGWNQLGKLLHRTGDLDGAGQAYSRVLSLAGSTDDSEIIAMASRNLGNLYFIRGDLDRAEQTFRKGLAILEALGHKKGMAYAYSGLGRVYTTRGDFDRAEEMYRKSLEINEALGDKIGVYTQYLNLHYLYGIRGDFDRAEEMYRKSLEINEALGDKIGMVIRYMELAYFYQTRGDLDRAEEMYRKGLEISEAVGLKQYTAVQYLALGTLYEDRGDLDRAEEMYKKSLELYLDIPDRRGIEMIGEVLASIRDQKQ